jgi:AmmeMemoRadiSam system protein B
MDKASPPVPKAEIKILISPHAGYSYSGGVAAFGYKAVKGHAYKTVVVIGPSHYVPFEGISVFPAGGLRTPLGVVPIDEEVADRLITFDPRIRYYTQAFIQEHSVEVQMPFLQVALKEGFKVVPMVMGSQDLEDCRLLAKALQACLPREGVLIVVSTDLSHYHPYQEAVSMDQEAISTILSLDPQLLFSKAITSDIELCGLGGVVTALLYAQDAGLKGVRLLHYANSGDVTGDTSRVVGYASLAIFPTDS